MTNNIKKTLLDCYKAINNKVETINDFEMLFKYFDGFNLLPSYTTIGEKRELLGSVGLQFDFKVSTSVGIMKCTLFADDGNKDLELWDSFEYHPTEQSGCLGLFSVYCDYSDMDFEIDYHNGYVPIK